MTDEKRPPAGSMDGFRDYSTLLDGIRGLCWPSRRVVGTGASGLHRSSQRGTAGEFTEYRLYRQGDDPRGLDWKLLGRSDRAFIRLSDDRALLTTWLIADASASMVNPPVASGRRDKWRMSRFVAVGLAAAVHASGDPVGLITTGAGGRTRLEPRTRRGTVRDIARILDSIVCGGGDVLAPEIQPLSQNSRIVCLTDCLGDLEDLMRTASAQIATGVQFECVHLVAHEELELPGGDHIVRDPEIGLAGAGYAGAGGAVLAASTREGYELAFRSFRERLRHQWRAIGAEYTEVRTSDDPVRAVRAVVSGKGRC